VFEGSWGGGVLGDLWALRVLGWCGIGVLGHLGYWVTLCLIFFFFLFHSSNLSTNLRFYYLNCSILLLFFY
jgi:heme O synthase-like polyprenyltransferase